MTSVFFSHLVLGVGLGCIALTIGCMVDHKRWRAYAPYLFGAAIVFTTLVFIPHIGAEHGGGRRWISLAGLSFQPSETLKLATIIFASAYFVMIGSGVRSLLHGVGGFLAIVAVPSILLVLQPDIGTLGVIIIATLAIFVAAGARLHHIGILFLVALCFITILSLSKPYIRDRVTTFFAPSHGVQAEGYQIRQSLIAIGSGQLLGRGFGQGIQKFTYLPEPMGDSIFAVAAEELGFVGAVSIVLGFLFFGLRGFYVAARAADPFGRYLAVGITTYLVIEAFINIASMTGIAPLTGIPLTFVSQGGSAMLMSLASAGILIGISRRKAARSV